VTVYCRPDVRWTAQADRTGNTVAAGTHLITPSRRARHAIVEQLFVSLVTAIGRFCLVNRDTLVDINPTFESDTKFVPTPPEQSAFSNCEKVVKRDVEVNREKAQSICMNLRVR
jgi:hypothetical protein